MSTQDPAVEPQRRPSTMLRRVLLLALALALLAVAAVAWLRSDGARIFAARRVESIIDGEIRGSMSIGSLDRIDEEGVAGTHIVFYDELGTPVLEAEKAALSVDWMALLQGRFISEAGFVHGGRLTLDIRPDGQLSISRAFDSANPGPEGQPIGEDVVRLEHLDISAIEVGMAAEGASAFRANNVRARIRARVPENGAIDFGAERVRARLHLEAAIPVDLTLRSGQITLDGASRNRARLNLLTRVGGEGVRARVQVTTNSDENMHVDVHLHPESPGAVFTAAHLFSQAAALGVVSDALDVTVDL